MGPPISTTAAPPPTTTHKPLPEGVRVSVRCTCSTCNLDIVIHQDTAHGSRFWISDIAPKAVRDAFAAAGCPHA